MDQHLAEDALHSYILNTLTDAEREVLDRHLHGCSTCRAALAERQEQQTTFQTHLLTALNAAQPSPRMNFAALAPTVQQSRRFTWLRQSWDLALDVAPTAAAMVGLGLATAGLLRNVTWPTVGLQQSLSTSLPLSACLMLGVPVYTNYNRTHLQRRSELLSWGATLLLWLGTAVLGLYEMVILREVLLRAHIRFGPSSSLQLHQAQALGSWGVFFMGALWVVLAIGGAEFHYRHMGQRISWKIFAWTLAIQLALLALPLLV